MYPLFVMHLYSTLYSGSSGTNPRPGPRGQTTTMEVPCCCQIFAFIAVLLVFLYRTFRLAKPNANLVKSFLRNEKSDSEQTSSPALVAHRGGSAEAPENTLAAFKMANENGATGVEFDVDFTKDGKAVVIHDSTVDRTTDGSGLVSEFTFDEIRKLDASCKHPLRQG